MRMLFRDERVAILRWKCSADEGGSTEPMRQSWYVCSFTHSGTFVMHAGDQSQNIDATRAMVIRPGQPFHMTRCNESRATGGAVAIRPDVFENIAGRGDRCIALYDVPASVFLLQHLLLRSAEQRDPDVAETALRVVEEMLYAQSKSTRPAMTETTVDVQTLLAAKLTERVRLGEIARAVQRSPSHLCRTFHQETGLRMRNYLQRLRICASVENVLDRRTNLSVLAQTLGYSSHSHFGDAFRRELGFTPMQVRRIAALPTLALMRHALRA
jgi:AraC-like DNA-binding protein